MKFVTPTPVQSAAIPIAIAGHDLIASAQTGTGKTAAFAIPMIVRLLQAEHHKKTAVVLAPTRELALQIFEAWRDLTHFVQSVQACCLIGGAPMPPQLKALSQRPRVIIATPGRLIDHLERRSVSLSAVGILVLDEADRMLDMGFAPQLRQILRTVPKERQTLLFSATWGSAMDQIARQHMHDPQRVTIGITSQAGAMIEQKVITTTSTGKNETLVKTLQQCGDGSVLIFARTKSRTDRVARYLEAKGFDVKQIHGDRTQGQRTAALSAFREGRVQILVATDIASRGIDVADIAHVINYDLPQATEDYVHRIGRTGRAGASGSAISFVTPEDLPQWHAIKRHLQKTGSVVPACVFH